LSVCWIGREKIGSLIDILIKSSGESLIVKALTMQHSSGVNRFVPCQE